MNEILALKVDDIVPNPNQPRKYFDEQALQELADSIKADGLQEPILVRPKGDKYEIVQGERRWRAHKLAGLDTIQAKMREVSDEEAFHLAVIENIQREQLTPIEEAEAFQRYVEMGYTHEEIAKKVSKSRTYVTDRLQLLKLIPEIQDMIAKKQISGGHVKYLMKLKNQVARLMGTEKTFELLQFMFYSQHKMQEKITVKELNEWVENLRTLFLTAIIGTFNGYGDTVIGSFTVDKAVFEYTLKRVCYIYDLHIKQVKREDIHFLLERVLARKPANVKVSEIYKTYEDLEELIFDSNNDIESIWVSRGMDRKQLKEKTLEEITKDILKNKKILEDYARERGHTFDELTRDLKFIFSNP